MRGGVLNEVTARFMLRPAVSRIARISRGYFAERKGNKVCVMPAWLLTAARIAVSALTLRARYTSLLASERTKLLKSRY